MTGIDTPPHPIEKKVLVPTAVHAAIGIVLALLVFLQSHPEVIAGLPNWVSALLLAVGTPLITFLTGYLTPHTPRPDLARGGQAVP